MLPYFIRAEANTRLGGPYHGRTGPLHVEDRRYSHELSRAWVEAAVAWGLKPTSDFNGAAQEGAGLYQVTCKRGRRWSAADAYLNPALERPNLVVRTGSLATGIVLAGGRAPGWPTASRALTGSRTPAPRCCWPGVRSTRRSC